MISIDKDSNKNCEDCSYCSSCYSCSYCSYCSYSKNLRLSENMIFCLGEDKYASKGAGFQKNYQVFNQQVTVKEWNEIKSSLDGIKIYPTKWCDKKDMSAEEKKNISGWKTMGGYLKIYSYEEAWKIWWDNASREDKDKILNIKYFDAEIFKGITGIDVKVDDKISDKISKAIKLLKSKGYKIVKN